MAFPRPRGVDPVVVEPSGALWASRLFDSAAKTGIFILLLILVIAGFIYFTCLCNNIKDIEKDIDKMKSDITVIKENTGKIPPIFVNQDVCFTEDYLTNLILLRRTEHENRIIDQNNILVPVILNFTDILCVKSLSLKSCSNCSGCLSAYFFPFESETVFWQSVGETDEFYDLKDNLFLTTAPGQYIWGYIVIKDPNCGECFCTLDYCFRIEYLPGPCSEVEF